MRINKHRVSIGLPVFNGENYLEETLDSILSQTYTDFELIISDNASTDKTKDICQAYAARDSRIRYYRNETNLGAARNYNRLVELSSGEYFKWVAYDDPITAMFLQRCIEVLDRDCEVIMCYPRTILIDAKGKIIEYLHDGFDLSSSKSSHRFRQSFRSSAWYHPVFGLIRLDVLKKTGLIGNFASSDKVLLGELALTGKCVEIHEHLAYRRLHPQNSTEANTTDEAMAMWFDPATKTRVVPPRLMRLLELLRAINRVTLSPIDRLLCYIELGQFYLSPRRIAGAIKDLVQVVIKLRHLLSNHNDISS